MRIGSLFSGYGGLDIAVQSVLGGDLAWYSEIEPAACKVLAAHHPGVPNLGDITTVDWATVPSVDVLTGGYPCQPFSHAGKRKGTNDERHLWPYVRDAIAAIRPMVAVFENVDGHRSLGLADVLGDLAELGMSVRWGVVRAADAGAPHGRKRVFIVADSAERERHEVGGDRRSAQTSGAPRVQGAIRGGGGDVADADCTRPERDRRTGATGRLVACGYGGTLAAADAAGAERRGAQPEHLGEAGRSTAEPRERAGVTADPDRDGYGGGQDARRVGSLEAGDEGQAPERERARQEPGAGVAWGKYAAAIERWERLTRPAPEPTVPGRNGRPRLSPHFVEWMMGLPAGHVTGHDLSAAQELKMLGNGVVPQQAALALRLLGVTA